MSLTCTLPNGDSLTLELFDGKLLVFESPRAHAPGTPLRVRVDKNGSTLELKSIGSRKRTDGRFELKARITTMPKPVRDALNAHFGLDQTT
jgi:hypothetical protein